MEYKTAVIGLYKMAKMSPDEWHEECAAQGLDADHPDLEWSINNDILEYRHPDAVRKLSSR